MKRYKLPMFICALALLMGLSTAAWAGTVTVTKDGTNFSVDIDGNVLQSDVPPTVEQGTTLVPMRVIFETLGAKVDYDNAAKRITAVKDETTITLTLNQKAAYINGQVKPLPVPAKAVNGRTLVPLRFISEALGEDVKYVVKSAAKPGNTTATSYEETYYIIAENISAAMEQDNKALENLTAAYTYAEQYKTYGDSEFLSGAQTRYVGVKVFAGKAQDLTNKAIGNCGGFAEYVALKSTFRSINEKYVAINSLLGQYSAVNLNKVIDYYSEIAELWNTAMSQWTVLKPE